MKKLHIPQCLIHLKLKYTVSLNIPIHHDHQNKYLPSTFKNHFRIGL